MKGRDLNVLDGFMKNVKRYNEEVAHKILVDAERSSVQKGTQKSTCVICKIEQDINIKDVADSLWSVKAIDDNLYGQIIRPESNSEEQKTLWKKVFQSVNSLHTEHFDSAKIKLMDCLSKHSVSLEKNDNIFEKNQTKLICTCELDIGCKSIDSCSGASGTVIKPGFSNPSGESISNTVVIPVIHGGKRNNSVPVCKTAHLNASATGNDRKFFDSLMKPPVLPKRPSSLRRHSKGDLQSTISPAKSLDTSDVSLYDTPRTYLTLPRSRSSEQTSALDDATHKSPQEFCTDEAMNDQPGKSPLATCGIPALPVKKSKFPAWKKAKEQGPSFV
ncbi:uncharacterized protein LOC132720314 [Ruditapes philippinarum]|uniref:uncharacterized protein LOC132720314 n=1 Tax=Ruditapes philippinarum TaxID=129788 RepID=UPI00295A5C7C|nr:uncharacterized protein LOC132720314 [Ruditapes philippinarum]